MAERGGGDGGVEFSVPGRRRRLVAILTLIGGVTGLAPRANAGFTVQQKVVYTGEAAGSADLTWHIGEREFKLEVKRGADSRYFVFNGRVFYVCGKLDKGQLDYVRKLGLDKSLVANLEKGACQELTPDFAMKFFLSPYDAVGAVEAGAGFSTNLAVEDAEVELAGSVGTADKVKCVDFKRSYTIADKKRTNAAQELSEVQCNAPTIKWRQGFGRQLGMTLMRQPNGKQNFQTIAMDLKKMAGMTLATTAKISGKSAAGKAVARGHSVQTSAVKEGDVAATELSTPAGFDVLDEETLATAAAVAAKANTKGPIAAKGAPGIESTLKFLILGVNPASALLGTE